MTARSHRDLSSPIVRTAPGALSSEILLTAMHSAQRLERTCSRKRGIQRFRIRAFT
jgi:hypothetical protein